MPIARRDIALLISLWLLGRAIVIASFVAALGSRWNTAFAHWDASWYGQIVTHGYEYARDGHHHSVAFFPVYPLLSWALTQTGVAWPISGLIISNLAMLAALFVAFFLVKRWSSIEDARWTAAILALLPMALFSVTSYAEPLYLLLSAAVLLLYEQSKYRSSAFAGALASATRPYGVLLAIALIVDALRRRRAAALAAGIASLFGFAAFAFFCWHRFGDPLAFAAAQHSWRGDFGFDWAAWFAILQHGFAGRNLAVHAAALALLAIVVTRRRLDAVSLACGALFMASETWVWAYNAQTVLLIAVGGVATLAFRRNIGAPGVVYASFALVTLFASGIPYSADRGAYGIIPLDAALAMLARRYPALGYPAIGVMVVGLAIDAHAYAMNQWVA